MATPTLDDGIDVGWTYMSNTDLDVIHHFGGTLMVEAKAKKKSRMTALGVSKRKPGPDLHPVNRSTCRPSPGRHERLKAPVRCHNRWRRYRTLGM